MKTKYLLLILLISFLSGFSQELALARQDGKFGYINKDGEWQIQPNFKVAKNFSGELAEAMNDKKKWGFINRKGEWKIEPSFDKTKAFNSGVAMVLDSKQWIYINEKGEKIMDLETSDISELKAKNWQAPIEFTTKARDEKTDLYGLLFLPSHYDESKKYPVLNYIYPGPQSGSVGNYGFRPVWRDFQAVSELGFVVVAVDAMGTPSRSKSFHDAYYGNMGDNGNQIGMAKPIYRIV